MFQRILAPLGGATRGAAAVRIASALALRTSARLVQAQTEPSYAPAQYVSSARAALQRQVNALRRQGIQAEYAIEIGPQEAGTLAVARDRQVDLILLAPTQRRRLELLWYPRSATRLLNELPAPLLIWPESRLSADLLTSGDATVMAPLDGSADAERSLPFAVRMAEQYHRSLVLVRAEPGAHGPARSTEQTETASAYLRDVSARLERMTQIPIYTDVVVGEPGSRLLLAANTVHVDVVVLCAHSNRAKERYFLGCVATQLLHQGDVPLLIAPPQVKTMRPALPHDVAAPNGRLVASLTA